MLPLPSGRGALQRAVTSACKTAEATAARKAQARKKKCQGPDNPKKGKVETVAYATRKRKSAAYHAALKSATLAGKSQDDAKACARKAYAAMD